MPNDQNIPYAFPAKGIDVSQAYDAQPEDTAREAVNVRYFEAITQRGRGGIRPGLSRFIAQPVVGNVLVQHIAAFPWTTGQALREGTVGGDGLQMQVDFSSGGGFIFLALDTRSSADNGTGTSSGRSLLSGLPPTARVTQRTLVAYLAGTDQNSYPIYVDGSTRKRVQFQGSLTATYTVTPSDYQAATYTLNGEVYELRSGSEVRMASLDFSYTNQATWHLPFFAYQLSNGKIGFKDNVLTSVGTTMTSTFTMAGVCTSSTTTVAYGVNSGTASYAALGLVAYTPPSTPTINSAVTLGVSVTTFSCCSDGTNFYGAGINASGQIKLVKATPGGTASWTQTGPGPWSLGHNIASAGNVDNDQQGSSCVVIGTTLYVYFPQWGIAKYSTSDGSLIGKLMDVGKLTVNAGGYRGATANFDGHPPLMAAAGNVLCVPIQTSAKGYSSGCRHGLVFVDTTTGSLTGVSITGLGPSAYPAIVCSDGTDFYALIPEDSGADMNTVRILKTHADGAIVWSKTPFATNGPNSNNREAMIYISGSKQLFAGNNYETLVMTTDGDTSRSIAALSTPPEWLTDAGSA